MVETVGCKRWASGRSSGADQPLHFQTSDLPCERFEYESLQLRKPPILVQNQLLARMTNQSFYEGWCVGVGSPGPLNHVDDQVDSDQKVVNKGISLCIRIRCRSSLVGVKSSLFGVEGAGGTRWASERWSGYPLARPVHQIISMNKWIRTSRS